MASNCESDSCRPRTYIMGEILRVEEDLHHEFKGHRNICREDIPVQAVINKTRRPISRNLCGFLNTGAGGTVYCGVTDRGEVIGIHLTEYQKDHVLLSVQDVFSRFDPPVDSTMFSVVFVPVVPTDVVDFCLNLPPVDAEQRKQKHLLRTSKYCWCDEEASAKHDMGIISQGYVIEIHVLPWNPKSKLAVTPNTPIQPLFSNEEDLHFIRRHGGLHQPTLKEIIQLAEAETIQYHMLKKK